MKNFLRLFFLCFAGVCFAIGVTMIAVGPAPLATALSVLFPAPNETIQFAELAHPNTDGEMRFYSALFVGFAIFIFYNAWPNPIRHRALVAAMLIFFLGGLARGLSIIQLGAPAPLFQLLFLIELLVPAATIPALLRLEPITKDHA